jgi:cell division protease FtsH
VFLALNWLAVTCLWSAVDGPPLTLPYSVFKQQLQAGNVATVTSRDGHLQGTLKQPVTYPPGGSGAQTSTRFQTQLPGFAAAEVASLLAQSDAVVSALPPAAGTPAWLAVLLSFGPVVLLAALFFGLIRWMSGQAQQAQGGLFDLGRSRARRFEQTPDQAARITFADVAGIDEARADLEEVVDFLQRPARYQRLGGVMPKGVLLVGPPGTGKTLLAKAVAGEAGVPFFSLSGSEFVEMIVGVGAARVRDLFAQATKAAPAIVFIDELDAIGRRRGSLALTGANQEQEQALNQILTELDGFDARRGVVVLAATNRPDVLDPALLRPGRFDRRVVVPRPDRAGRERILRVHARGVPLAGDVDLGALAAATPGLVGAELRNLVNEAALEAARRDRDAVTRPDFDAALERLVLGAARTLVMRPEERRRVAYHEAGHALLGLLLPEADPVQKVTIVPRGQALGATYQVPPDDRLSFGEAYLRARIAGALGGRAAEALVLGAVSTGAEDDLEQATALARRMVTRWGMSDAVGLLAVARPESDLLGDGPAGDGRVEAGAALADLVDRETQRILAEGYARAQQVLAGERGRLVALAEALAVRESLDEAEIRSVTGLAATAAEAPPGASPTAATTPAALPPPLPAATATAGPGAAAHEVIAAAAA